MLIFLLLLIYTWLLYPFIIILLSRLKATKTCQNDPVLASTTTIIIPVYNSAELIARKIQNCREIEQGKELPIIIVSDGSDDNIAEIVTSLNDQNISFIELKQRSGKSAAQNTAVEKANTDLILFTDVDTMLEASALTNLISHLHDSPDTACVGGRIKFQNSNTFQKLYWCYENTLRNAESKLGLLTSISGAGFLVRADKLIPLDVDTGDDMVIPLDMKLHHKMNTVFCNQVIGTDQLAKKEKDILTSRRRITRRNLIVIARRTTLLNPLNDPSLAASIFSHKLLRWFTPFLLLGLFISLISVLLSHALLSAGLMVVVIGLYLVYTARNFSLEIIGLLLGVIDFIKGTRTTYY